MAERICSHPDCANEHHSAGLCGMHYQRRRRRASPGWIGPRTIAERFAAHSEERDGCLVWTGSLNSKGYGMISLVHEGYGRSAQVHRVAWIERHGQPPAETPYVLHRCDNPPCFRDEHLWLGTQADNIHDMHAKGRDRYSRLRAIR